MVLTPKPQIPKIFKPQKLKNPSYMEIQINEKSEKIHRFLLNLFENFIKFYNI